MFAPCVNHRGRPKITRKEAVDIIFDKYKADMMVDNEDRKLINNTDSGDNKCMIYLINNQRTAHLAVMK